MRHRKLILSTLFLLIIGLAEIQAQETITTTGGNASGSGGTVSFTVGQVVYTTNTGANGSVAQGVQQPYEISVISGLKEAKGIILQCNAYPNPVTDYIKLKIENYKIEDLNYQIFDITGKLLESKKIDGNETSIAMSNLVPGTYFLKINQIDREIKTFKIIKN